MKEDGEGEGAHKVSRIKNVVSNWFGLESSPSYADTSGVVYEGFLRKQRGSGEKEKKTGPVLTMWQWRWFVLTRGSLYFYKDQLELVHYGVIQLKTCKIADPSVMDKKASKKDKCRFVLASPTQKILLEATDEENLKQWVSKLETCVGNDPSDPPKRQIAAKKSSLFATGKIISEKAAMSKAGQKLMREFAPEEAIELLDCTKNVLNLLNAKTPGRGKELYNHILKIVLKSLLLYKGKYITNRDLAEVQLPLFRLWSLFLDSIDLEFARNYEKLEKRVQEVHVVLANLLRPHLTPKTINHRLKPVMEFFEKTENLKALLESKDPELHKESVKLGKSLRRLWDGLPEDLKKNIHNIQLLST